MTRSHSLESQMQLAEPIVVLGMHRSGTSLVTRLLTDAGIYMGSQLTVNAEAPFFQKLNQLVFADVGATWSKVGPIVQAMSSPDFVERQAEALKRILLGKNTIRDFFQPELWPADSDLPKAKWGWKDPRTTLTFPVWLRIFPQARFVHVLRNGVDVAISIHRRSCKIQQQWWKWWWYQIKGYGSATLDFAYDLDLWEQYVSFALQEKQRIAPGRYYELHYEALLKDPYTELARLLSFLQIECNESQVMAVAQQVKSGGSHDSRYISEYQEEIHTFASRPIMQQLGYLPPQSGRSF